MTDETTSKTNYVGTAGEALTDLGGMSTAMKAEVNAECDTALTDYAGATSAELATHDGKLDTVDGIVDQIVFHTGTTLPALITSHDSIVAGAFTEIKGATWSSSTDTLEAIRDRGDAAWITGAGGSGSGARTVTVTVDDGATVLENATVRFTEGANTFTGLTNASGVIVFSLDDATYAVSITKAGYTFTPTTKIVNGTEADTYSMSIVAITAPPNAATTTGVMLVYDEEGVLEEGVTITVQIIDGPGTDGIGYDSTEWAELSSALGVVEFAGIILGARYKIWRGTSKPEAQTFTAPTTGTSFDLAEVIGRG